MRARELHPWDVSAAQARAIQASLRARVRVERLAAPVRLVAGADAAYGTEGDGVHAAAVVLDLEGLRVVDAAEASCRVPFPYLPGLLGFRELPALLAALARLERDPDVLMLDGQGLAHPRRFGLACHAGLLLDRPTLGCAKTRLLGRDGVLGAARGAWSPLVHGGAVVGAALRTRSGTRPVYVSPGHRIDLDAAIRLVLATARHRIPEPLRLAHQAASRLRRRAEGA